MISSGQSKATCPNNDHSLVLFSEVFLLQMIIHWEGSLAVLIL